MNWITDLNKLSEYEDYRILVELDSYPVFKVCDFDSCMSYRWYFDSGPELNLIHVVRFMPLGIVKNL